VNVRKKPPGNKDEAIGAIGRLLSTIAAIFVRLGLDSPQSERLLRMAFVQAALQRVRNEPQRLTQARIASLTGLSRLEVRTILRGRGALEAPQTTRIDHVVQGWKTDPQFLDDAGKPKHLDMRGRRSAFVELARKYGRDVTAHSLRDDLVRRGLVAIRESKLVLQQNLGAPSGDARAAEADLKFLSAHLASIDFQLGRRAYVLRQSAISADDKRTIEMLKRIAVGRLETVFSSLSEMSADTRSNRKKKTRQSRRLLVTAIVATEAEDKKS
jgi:transcriptional regulator with XRE-family HTH domain